jgi:hypothetical protein
LITKMVPLLPPSKPVPQSRTVSRQLAGIPKQLSREMISAAILTEFCNASQQNAKLCHRLLSAKKAAPCRSSHGTLDGLL